ncbi:MAG: glutamate--tRNA ligase family protein [Pseudobacter sp.]|uniref:glutamate--tRNA ligase family protein n=1 Tax=Pseudobacter sp. TaxID=2045420 RepID=UPI003F80F549
MSTHPFCKKTRLAPTPSGFLHLGNIFSFILTADLARKKGASILLRIDDMDQARAQDQYLQDIFDTLNFLEIHWDEGPRNVQEFKETFSQTHRLPIYNELLTRLKNRKKVFACNCSRSLLQQTAPDGIYPGTCLHKGIPLDTPDVNWRLITNTTETFRINSLETNIFTYSLDEKMSNFVVRKKDGLPSYQLASLADDIHFDIDLIVRGLDLRPSTIAQRYLANQLKPNSFQKAAFMHHILLTDETGNKLSKTAGSISIQYLRKEGKKKEDIFKLIARLTNTNEKGIHNWQSFADAFFKED